MANLIRSMRRILLVLLLCGLETSIFGAQTGDSMNAVAERYAHLVLALGQHDPDCVDAFYGPAEWKTQAEKEKKSLDAIGAEAAELMKKLRVERTAAPLVDNSDAGWEEQGQIYLHPTSKSVTSVCSLVASR